MNKILIFFLVMFLLIVFGCSREVHETKEYYKVDPNVKKSQTY